MKKALKIIGFVLLGIVAIVAILLSYVAIADVPTYKQKEITVNVEYTPERVTEGHRIVATMCKNCHLNPETGKLTGMNMLDFPPAFGKAWSQNITSHKTDGIGGWTDAQLVYFLRTSIKPNGTFAAFMPSIAHYSDEDLASVVSFLRSDHPWLEATPGRQPENEYTFLSKMLARTMIKPMKYPEGSIPQPDTTDPLAFGKYLVTAKWDCYGCHSANFSSNNTKIPEKSKGFMGGGNTLLDLEGNEIYSANITFHETGIAGWTEDDFLTALKTGKTPNGAFRYPMIPFSNLTDTEMKAIYAYLKTIPKIENVVERNTVAETVSN